MAGGARDRGWSTPCAAPRRSWRWTARPVGDGRPGPLARALAAALAAARGLDRGAEPCGRAQLAARRRPVRSAAVATRRPSRRIALSPSESFSRSSVFAMSRPDSSAIRSSRYRTVWRCV